jgi:hypothetical protein
LALTEAFPLSVNEQVFWPFPPLEQVPDQMAVRPPETESVTPVPAANDACPELPTATLIPAGLDATLCPLRPVAETVRVTVGGGGGAAGFTNRGASSVRPPAIAKTVSPVCAVTTAVGTEKLTLV